MAVETFSPPCQVKLGKEPNADLEYDNGQGGRYWVREAKVSTQFYILAQSLHLFSKFVKPEVGVDQKYGDGKDNNTALWIREAKVCKFYASGITKYAYKSFKVLKPEVEVDQKYADGKNGSLWVREAKVRLAPVKN